MKNNGGFIQQQHQATLKKSFSYFTQSENVETELCVDSIKTHLRQERRQSWQTLEELLAWRNGIHQLQVAHNIGTDNWQDRKIICSCTDYLKNNICIHVLALAVILTVAKFPLEAKNTQLKQLKKKRSS